MADVPYVPYAQKENSGAPTQQISVPNANAEAFGAGVGVAAQRLGATLEQSGQIVGDQVLKFQNLQNESTANDMLTKAEEEIGNEKMKLYQLDGQNAVNYLPEYQKNIQAIRDKYNQSAPNPMVGHMLDMQLTRRAGFALIDGSQHAGSQAKVALTAARNGRIAQAQNDSMSAGEAEFQSNLATLKTTAESEALDKFGPGDDLKAARDTYVQQQVGVAWDKRLGLQAMTDPAKAQEILNKVPPDQMSGEQRIRVQETINRAAVSVGSRVIAQSTSPMGSAGGDVASRYNYGVKFWEQKGYSHEQAIGIMNNFTHESGGKLDPHATAVGDGADGSNSIGIGQWNGKRAQQLLAFARSKGTDWKDLNTQLEFANQELETTESAGKAAVKAAGNRNQATEAFMTSYERPGIPALGNRLAYSKYATAGVGTDSAAPPKLDAKGIEDWVQRSRDLADKQFPGNVAVADQAEARVRQEAARQTSLSNQYAQEKFQSVQASVAGLDENGNPTNHKPTTLDELIKGNPDMARAYYSMTPDKQVRIDAMLEKNAKGTEYGWTPEAYVRYKQLKGMQYNDPAGFKNELLIDEKLPHAAILELMRAQTKPIPDDVRLGVSGAISTLRSTGLLEQAGLDQKTDPVRFNHFTGALTEALESWKNDNPRVKGPVPDSAIIKMMPELVKDLPKAEQGFFARKGWVKPDTASAFEVDPKVAARNAAQAAKLTPAASGASPQPVPPAIDKQLMEAGIPGLAIPLLVQAYRSKYPGKEPTAEQITTLYRTNPAFMQKYPPVGAK